MTDIEKIMKQIKLNIPFTKLECKFGKNNKNEWSVSILERGKTPLLCARSGGNFMGLIINTFELIKIANRILKSRDLLKTAY
jgi:hypothetical protein